MYKLGKNLVSSLKNKVYQYSSFASNDATATANANANVNSQQSQAGHRPHTRPLTLTDLTAHPGATPAIGRKRSRDAITEHTPTLVHPNSVTNLLSTDSHDEPSNKLRRLNDSNDDTASSAAMDLERFQNGAHRSRSLMMDFIPQDVLQAHIFSCLTDATDHHALQLTCRKFHEVTNTPEILSQVNLTGDEETGKGSILHEVDVPDVAMQKLYKFAAVGNQQAMYMIGMIAAYCHGDIIGVNILKQNSKNGCLRSAYTLGLILRDSDKKESANCLKRAIEKDYLPACQESLSSQAVKEKFGDLDYHTLKNFFDPIALNRLLGRSYLQSSGVRGVSTSHCWNPCCGRWALKATQNNGRGPHLQCSSKYLPPISSNIEFTLLNLLDDEFKEGGEMRFPRPMDERSFRVSRMKMCSSCRRAKYCSKLCQVYDWRSGQHKMECQFL